MKYVFGPVPSRRLGKSLGIDPIPLKTCNWNCVYCQLGRSVPLILERGEYVPRHELLAEVEQALSAQIPGEIDWVTFVGSGEPTLHAGIGWMIRQVKKLTKLPVAVITNGSLLYLPEVRDELSAADAILPTLDAANAWLYKQINRAAPRFPYERFVEGLYIFRRMYSGKLWVEVMLVHGMNDTPEALQELALVLKTIGPDQVQITLPLRPPAEAWVRPADMAGLQRAKEILGEVVPVVIPDSSQAQAARIGDLADTLLSVVTRHPMQEDELRVLLSRWSGEEVQAAIQELAKARKIQSVERSGHMFWSAATAQFPGRGMHS
jgi:wyosine [tRNA(Phe)-imidazoG37] synthetase (radical SAM superfamily)